MRVSVFFLLFLCTVVCQNPYRARKDSIVLRSERAVRRVAHLLRTTDNVAPIKKYVALQSEKLKKLAKSVRDHRLVRRALSIMRALIRCSELVIDSEDDEKLDACVVWNLQKMSCYLRFERNSFKRRRCIERVEDKASQDFQESCQVRTERLRKRETKARRAEDKSLLRLREKIAKCKDLTCMSKLETKLGRLERKINKARKLRDNQQKRIKCSSENATATPSLSGRSTFVYGEPLLPGWIATIIVASIMFVTLLGIFLGFFLYSRMEARKWDAVASREMTY